MIDLFCVPMFNHLSNTVVFAQHRIILSYPKNNAIRKFAVYMTSPFDCVWLVLLKLAFVHVVLLSGTVWVDGSKPIFMFGPVSCTELGIFAKIHTFFGQNSIALQVPTTRQRHSCIGMEAMWNTMLCGLGMQQCTNSSHS